MEKQMEMRMEKRMKRRAKAKKRLRVVLIVVLTLAISTGAWCLLLGRSGMALVEGWLLARYAFVDTQVDLEQVSDEALYTMVDAMGDRWSYYLDEENYLRVKETRTNRYVGVGITITYEREEGLLVQAVSAGGPADQAGVVPGDIVIAVDGISIAGEARYEGADLIGGEQGTSVELTLLGADGGQRTVICKRASIQNPSASGTMLADHVGYVKLTNFYTGSADSMRTEVDRLIAEGAGSLIIDLRDNPGGYIAQLKQILDYLLPEGPVFMEKARWWFASTYESDEDCVDLPMVVLVNEDTYSAAELLAAQLRESAGVPIVGEHTSGKGYSQILFPMPNGGGMGVSVATYCTGSGHSLIGEGIIPDIELDDEDGQLQAAIDLLKD